MTSDANLQLIFGEVKKIDSNDIIVTQTRLVVNGTGKFLYACSEYLVLKGRIQKPFIMATLRNRASHYILLCRFYRSSSSFFFHRIISAVADWMSIILLHMMWP